MARRRSTPATPTPAPAPISANPPALAAGEEWAARLPAPALARCLAGVLPATRPGRPDPARAWPSAVALLAEPAGLRVVATDGHVLAVATVPPGVGLALAGRPAPALVDAAEVRRLLAALRAAVRGCYEARVGATATAITVEVTGATIRLPRAADDGWPRQYAQVVPGRRATDDVIEAAGATYWSAPILARVAECLAGYGGTASDGARLAPPADGYAPLRADLGGVGGDGGITVVAMPMHAPDADRRPVGAS